MSWFHTEEDAAAQLATIERRPGWTYNVVCNSSPYAWGIRVRDGDGRLISNAYTPGEDAVTPMRTTIIKDDPELYKTLVRLESEDRVVKRAEHYYAVEKDPSHDRRRGRQV